jgi:hypothetical protein
MAFVNELIPEDEKEKFTFTVSTRLDGSRPTLWKWTTDKERNVFLVLRNVVGGAYEGTQETEHYVLSWNGDLIFFDGEPAVSQKGQEKPTLTWHITKLDFPSRLQNQREEVIKLISEALDAQGLLYSRERVKAVRVNFDHE